MHTSNLFNNPLSDLVTASTTIASSIKNKLSMMSSNHNTTSIPPSNAARRCLFGPPDPKSIENLFQECSAIERLRGIRNYGYDTHKDQFVDRNDMNAYENALNALKENCANGLIDTNRIDRIQNNYDHLFSELNDMQKIDLIINRDQLLTDTYANGSNGYMIGLDMNDREDAIEINENIKFQLDNSYNDHTTSNRTILQRCVYDYRNNKPVRKDRRDAKSSPYNRINKNTDKYQQKLQSPPTKKSKDDHTE